MGGKKIIRITYFPISYSAISSMKFPFEVNNYDRERGFAEWLNKLETVCKLQKVKNLEYISSSALK